MVEGVEKGVVDGGGHLGIDDEALFYGGVGAAGAAGANAGGVRGHGY